MFLPGPFSDKSTVTAALCNGIAAQWLLVVFGRYQGHDSRPRLYTAMVWDAGTGSLIQWGLGHDAKLHAQTKPVVLYVAQPSMDPAMRFGV